MQGGVLCSARGSGEGGGEEQPGKAEGGSEPASGATGREEEKEEEESWTSEPDGRAKTSWQLPVQVYVNVNGSGFRKVVRIYTLSYVIHKRDQNLSLI